MVKSDLFKVIKSRRSIRKYTNENVSNELIEKLIDAARYAPSSHNSQPWEFVVVRDKEKIKKLSKTHMRSGFLVNAPVVIVVCVDTKKCELYPGNICSTSAAVENILLAATGLNLATCWVYAHESEDYKNENYIRKILDIPEHLLVLCMIPVGYAAETPGKKKVRDLNKIIHYEKF